MPLQHLHREEFLNPRLGFHELRVTLGDGEAVSTGDELAERFREEADRFMSEYGFVRARVCLTYTGESVFCTQA
jgi:hypothetical protein